MLRLWRSIKRKLKRFKHRWSHAAHGGTGGKWCARRWCVSDFRWRCKAWFKRAKMTNERIQLVANTLMLEGNMRQFGHILRSNAKGHFAQGSKKYFEAFAKLLNSKNHPLLHGCFVGVEALQQNVHVEEGGPYHQKRVVPPKTQYRHKLKTAFAPFRIELSSLSIAAHLTPAKSPLAGIWTSSRTCHHQVPASLAMDRAQ